MIQMSFDPDKFIPERWNDTCSDGKAGMERSLFAFGARPRPCIGSNFSFIEIQKVVTQLLRQLEVTLADPKKKWAMSNACIVQQKGLVCDVKRRYRKPSN